MCPGALTKTVDITYRFKARDWQAKPLPLDSDAARTRLDDGNRAFAALLDGLKVNTRVAQRIVHVDPHAVGLLPGGAEASIQRPFAAILGCSDARVPVELIFTEGPNDLFVVRVAGNGLGAEVLGSLRYAAELLSGSLRLIVVLGHSGCGAVSTAVDLFLSPSQYLPLAAKSSLRNVLDPLLITVQACARKFMETSGPDVVQRPGYREALIEASVITNAALAAYSIEQELNASDRTDLRAVYGVYLLDTHRVWTPSFDMDEPGLASPPRDPEAFLALGDAIVRSQRIGSLL